MSRDMLLNCFFMLTNQREIQSNQAIIMTSETFNCIHEIKIEQVTRPEVNIPCICDAVQSDLSGWRNNVDIWDIRQGKISSGAEISGLKMIPPLLLLIMLMVTGSLSISSSSSSVSSASFSTSTSSSLSFFSTLQTLNRHHCPIAVPTPDRWRTSFYISESIAFIQSKSVTLVILCQILVWERRTHWCLETALPIFSQTFSRFLHFWCKIYIP